MSMADNEYLVSYGRAGEFGRFRPTPPDAYERGDRVVVRNPDGVELGVVLCPVLPGHGRFLSRTAVGELLRRLTDADEAAARRAAATEEQLFADARRLTAELRLPVEVLDAEVLLDGERAVLHFLGRHECDHRPFVSQLSRRYNVLLRLHNLALPPEPEEHGCGRPDCGQSGGGGGCNTCGTGGGCSTCGKGVGKEEITAYLSGSPVPAAGRARTPLV
jgi:PSP1 C-terminal conserved region